MQAKRKTPKTMIVKTAATTKPIFKTVIINSKSAAYAEHVAYMLRSKTWIETRTVYLIIPKLHAAIRQFQTLYRTALITKRCDFEEDERIISHAHCTSKSKLYPAQQDSNSRFGSTALKHDEQLSVFFIHFSPPLQRLGVE